MSISPLEDGSFLLTGTFGATATFGPDEENETPLTSKGGSDVFVARYDSDGTLVWARRGGGEQGEGPGSIDTLPDGTATVVGTFSEIVEFGEGDPNQRWMTTRGFDDIFIVRYDPEGALTWARRVGGEKNDTGRGISVLPDGSALFTGLLRPPVVFGFDEENETWVGNLHDYGYHFYLARYNPDSTLAWVTSATGRHGHDAGGTDIHAFPDGTAFVTGWFFNTVTFGSGEPSETVLESIAGEYPHNIFVVRFSADSSLAWARYALGADCASTSISALEDGSTVVTGAFEGTAVFDPGGRHETHLTAKGSSDVFVFRLGP